MLDSELSERQNVTNIGILLLWVDMVCYMGCHIYHSQVAEDQLHLLHNQLHDCTMQTRKTVWWQEKSPHQHITLCGIHTSIIPACIYHTFDHGHPLIDLLWPLLNFLFSHNVSRKFRHPLKL